VTSPAWRITLADVSIGDREREAVDAVLRSGWLSMGPMTERFERDFADYLGSPHALAVTNGTAALHLAAAALGLGPGDEVICPALTFVASAAAMRQTGATVALADSLSLDDFSLDPDEIDRLAGPRTKAVVLVHYGGYPADVDAVLTRAHERGLFVIEDAAHALGAEVDGRHCGTFGDAGCFSFFPNKNMTTGEGGMVVFRDEEAAERARLLRSHAMTTMTWDRHRGHASSYDVLGVGFNYRIDELRAALGVVQLSRLDEFNAARAEFALQYRDRLAKTPTLAVPTFGGRGTSAYHLAPIVCRSGDTRDQLRELLQTRRIQTSIHYPSISTFREYRDSVPRAEEIATRTLTAPLHPNLTAAGVDEVCDLLLGAVS
jgi:dTDP-4-amino-4,6-dideoxygalactose transaminase